MMDAQEKFIWYPSPERIERSNLKRLMDRYAISNFKELRLKSVEDPSWFWDAVSRDLGVEWFHPYSQVLDLKGGAQFPNWFVGGKTNIAFNCLDKHVSQGKGSNVALIAELEGGERKSLTFTQLEYLTNKIANTLSKDLGIKRGDKVGIYLPMIPEAVATFLAVAKMGAIVVPIFSGYGAEAVGVRLEDCEAKAIITAGEFTRRGKRISMLDNALTASRRAKVNSLLVFQNRECVPENPKEGLKIVPWSSVLSSSDKFETEEMSSEDPFMIIYTSGTTGKPKGAVHVHGGFMVKITEEVAYQADLHEDGLLFWFTDLGWIMAPWEIVGALTLGASILIYDGAPDYPRHDRIWQVVEENKVSVFGLSPTLVRSMMKYGLEPVQKHDLSSLQSFGSTGEPWDEHSYTWLFENVGGRRTPIVNLSGGTEVGACFLSVHPILPIKACSLGGPSLGIDADVVDESGKPVRLRTGELVIRNPWPSMTRSLWKNKPLYLANYWSRFEGLWVHGDWASIDTDGYWFLHGRSDDTLKIAGRRVGPAEVEGALASHGSVLESAAIGVPDETKGEAILCFAVLRPGVSQSSELREELREHVGKALGPTMKPKSIFFVSSLPKTRNAKIVRRLVRASYLHLPFGDTSNLENPDALESISNAS